MIDTDSHQPSDLDLQVLRDAQRTLFWQRITTAVAVIGLSLIIGAVGWGLLMIIDITTDSRTAVNTLSDLTSEDTERQQDANTQRVAAANVITITHNVDCNTREAIQQALNELARNNPHLTPVIIPPCPTK